MNGSDERRRFTVTVTAPDWGQDHLSSDAIVAYVDDELADRPHSRAARHLDTCPECVAEVVAQGQARLALRSAECPSLPSALLRSLCSIPQDTELADPSPGLAVTDDGRIVTVVRPEKLPRPVDVPPAGLASSDNAPASHGRRPPVRRLYRLGAGAAVSGLAIGALALGAPGLAGGPPPSAPADRGVFDGPVLGGPSGVLEARFRLLPAARQDSVMTRMDLMPDSFRLR